MFYIKVLNRTLKYKVDQIKTVLPDKTSDLHIIEGEDHVTLLTCTPYGLNSHRLLVRGTRTAYNEKKHEDRIDSIATDDNFIYLLGYRVSYLTMWTFIAVFLTVAGLLIWLAVKKNQKKHRTAAQHSQKDGG